MQKLTQWRPRNGCDDHRRRSALPLNCWNLMGYFPWCLRQVPLTRYMLLSGRLSAVKDFCFDRTGIYQNDPGAAIISWLGFYHKGNVGHNSPKTPWNFTLLNPFDGTRGYWNTDGNRAGGLPHVARKVIMGLLRNGNPQKVGIQKKWRCHDVLREQNSRRLGNERASLVQEDNQMKLMKCLQFNIILQYFQLQLLLNSFNPHSFSVHYGFDTFESLLVSPFFRLKTCCQWWRRMSFPSMMWCFKRHTIWMNPIASMGRWYMVVS